MSDNRPNLLIIGARKASSTLLHNILSQHPAIFMSDEKEPHYFTSDSYGEPGAFNKYLENFASAPVEALYRGESSTGYAIIPDHGPTPERIAADLGCPKLIYIIRDPVDRIVSNFRHAYMTDAVPRTSTLGSLLESETLITNASCYLSQIEAYEAVFGAGSVLVLVAEKLHGELRASRRKSLAGRQGSSHISENQLPQQIARVLEHLELDSVGEWFEPSGRVNSQEQLRSSVAATRLVGSGLKKHISRCMPSLVKRIARDIVSRLSPPPEPPMSNEGERMLAFELIQDDLRGLRDRLGDEIDIWPSVKRFGSMADTTSRGESRSVASSGASVDRGTNRSQSLGSSRGAAAHLREGQPPEQSNNG